MYCAFAIQYGTQNQLYRQRSKRILRRSCWSCAVARVVPGPVCLSALQPGTKPDPQPKERDADRVRKNTIMSDAAPSSPDRVLLPSHVVPVRYVHCCPRRHASSHQSTTTQPRRAWYIRRFLVGPVLTQLIFLPCLYSSSSCFSPLSIEQKLRFVDRARPGRLHVRR
jgi:hypothetical protein